MALLDWLSTGADKLAGNLKNASMTWKVIQLDGPLPKEIGLPVSHDGKSYGVVISSDAMLEKTQTLLFCPLINGVDKDDLPFAALPWHVEVKVEDHPNYARIPFGRILMSTKIILPTSLNEIDQDRRQRGRLLPASRREAVAKLKKWLPLGPDIGG